MAKQLHCKCPICLSTYQHSSGTRFSWVHGIVLLPQHRPLTTGGVARAVLGAGIPSPVVIVIGRCFFQRRYRGQGGRTGGPRAGRPLCVSGVTRCPLLLVCMCTAVPPLNVFCTKPAMRYCCGSVSNCLCSQKRGGTSTPQRRVLDVDG